MVRDGKGAVRAAILAVLLILATVAGIGDLHASSRICRDLEGQLARVSTGGGGSPARARQYEKAIADQHRQIDRARQRLRQAGCNGVFGIGAKDGGVCGSVRSTLERMTANLAGLERKHRQLSGGGGARDRARILAALDANGCRGSIVARGGNGRDSGAAPTGLFRVFGGGSERRREEARNETAPQTNRRSSSIEQGRQQVVIRNGNRIEIRPRFSGTFRTLCVRTCDGYFFPVSYSTGADELDRDQAACQAMCPGTEVELFVHRTPEEEADQMVSLAGTPYADLPNAFRYREPGYVRPQSCGCGVPASFSVMNGDGTAPEAAAAASSVIEIPLPRERPDPAADPETLANVEGGLDAAAIRAIVNPPAPEATADAPGPAPSPDRRVRVVGPAFLPDPEAAIDLQAQVPNRVQ